MDNTRDTLRRLWVYGLLLACAVSYGAMHPTTKDAALDRARAATSHAIDWLGNHMPRRPE